MTKEKLTKVQKEVMDAIENAYYSYKVPQVQHGRGGQIMHVYYENGKQLRRKKKSAFIMNENTVKVEAKTETLKALVKKGYIKDVEITKYDCDNVTLLKPIFEKAHTELAEIVFIANEETNEYARPQRIYSPVGQEEQALAAHKAQVESYNPTAFETLRIVEMNVVPCDYWKI